MNPGGRGCSEPRLHHCTPPWVTRVKLRLKKKNMYQNEERGVGKDSSEILRPFTGLHTEKEARSLTVKEIANFYLFASTSGFWVPLP